MMRHLTPLLLGSILVIVAPAVPSSNPKPLMCEHPDSSSVQETVEDAIEDLERDMQKLNGTLTLLKKLGDDVKYLREEVDEIRPVSGDAQTSIVNASDCRDIMTNGQLNEGVYRIYPRKGKSLNVYCKNGWTYIMKREDGIETFNRSWNDYQYGFGKLRKDHWIGLDNIHALTSSKRYDLRWVMSLDYAHKVYQDRWAQFNHFQVDSELELFRMTFKGRSRSTGSSDRGHWFAQSNGMRFTTYDFDNDDFSGNCATSYGGKAGWWYAQTGCGYSLTGKLTHSSLCTQENVVCARVYSGAYLRAVTMMLLPVA